MDAVKRPLTPRLFCTERVSTYLYATLVESKQRYFIYACTLCAISLWLTKINRKSILHLINISICAQECEKKKKNVYTVRAIKVSVDFPIRFQFIKYDGMIHRHIVSENIKFNLSFIQK